jgi:peptidoglycan/xylan/chitin deacetylase (PgdA/CDA1 family)
MVAAVLAACSSGVKRATSPASSSPPPTTGPTTEPASSPFPPATRFVSSGPRDRPHVALTFHVSGDAALVGQLLDVLDARSVRVTAFIVGSWLDTNSHLATRFTSAGHEIANHTYTHLTFPSLSQAQMQTEVDRCRDTLQHTLGTAGDFFRPSGTSNGTDDPGSVVHDVAHAAGYNTLAGFDVDPADYADPGAHAVASRTLAAVQPGSIVSLHFGHQGTIDAMPAILDGLQTRQLQPVTLSELLT